MNKDTEIDMKEVELNEVDPEKQPMTGDGQAAGGEKNGSVKLKVPDDEVTFTGLSKDELMKVAGTPGWVRTRWVLLVLFWLGWVGMLAGAIVIIVQAPRCKPIPEMNWWNEGPLYQVSDVEAFSDGLAGVEKKLDNINQLKVKGLVLGPLHTVQTDQLNALKLKMIDASQGSEADLVSLLEKAHKKGISVVLDLTPNYRGSSLWFNSADPSSVIEDVKAAAEYWTNLGVDGIKVSDVTTVSSSVEWSNLVVALKANRTDDTKKKMLMGVAEGIPAPQVAQLVNTSSVDLLLSDLLSTQQGVDRMPAIEMLQSLQRSLGWGMGAAQRSQLSKLVKTPDLIRLYQLLLFTMPGTPVFTYGDEIGLQAVQGGSSPKMVWDIETEPAEGTANETVEAERKTRLAIRKWFKDLSDLRVKERSLLHGDFYPLDSTRTALAFLRLWDQSDRYITVVNWGTEAATINFRFPQTEEVGELPKTAKVKLSTDPDLEVDATVNLDKITLAPAQGVLLHFPYMG
ncbi:4F2 cell-surface antigen heavy chain [Sphaeramia orbicularis]|uniref:Glycosyl hydrolase family 13 catalytic domain-containing protein n=1 Tax=Sphaeramia orbicularis TaxID=375764 RepID=A0A672YLU4_9TELE|nr:4F2 cell-surface antigen heavy chain [Sphaeramia orbicularis]XP_030018288.1 4F2 cell-surface antigen heavy chain [Sphaeramia orbicularis]